MKFTIIQEEGIDFSGEHYFGDPKDSLGDYFPFVKYELRHYILDNFFHLMNYAITEDSFLQITLDYQGYDFDDGHLKDPSGNPLIIAQYKRNGQELKTQMLEILEKYFDSFPSYLGYSPYRFVEGTFIVEKEFNDILQSITDKSKNNRKKAIESKRPAFANILEKYKLDPQPYGSDTITWLAICPRCRRHFLRFRFGELEWGCGYCNLNGKDEQEFIDKVLKIEAEKRYKDECKYIKPLGRRLTSEELIRLLM